ncbi:MAG: type III-A CRISPR-associated protein Csm2 [Desulfosoma sp.]
MPRANTILYYTDSQKEQLDPKLVDEKALEWARAFGRDLKSTQLRRFYDEFKAIERRILMGESVQVQEANLQRDLALIRMFKAKALYAEKRKVSPRSFSQFIFDHVESIRDIKDLKAFSRIFEAVVAFHRYFAADN